MNRNSPHTIIAWCTGQAWKGKAHSRQASKRRGRGRRKAIHSSGYLCRQESKGQLNHLLPIFLFVFSVFLRSLHFFSKHPHSPSLENWYCTLLSHQKKKLLRTVYWTDEKNHKLYYILFYSECVGWSGRWGEMRELSTLRRIWSGVAITAYISVHPQHLSDLSPSSISNCCPPYPLPGCPPPCCSLLKRRISRTTW